MDGKNALVIVSNDLSELDQIALDLSNQRVYFSESKAGRVCICNKLTNFFFYNIYLFKPIFYLIESNKFGNTLKFLQKWGNLNWKISVGIFQR